MLMGTLAWSAPKTARHKGVKSHAAKPKEVKPAAITEIRVSQDDGGHGGIHGGAGESWTLKSNGTVSHSVSVSHFQKMEMGDTQTPDASGTFERADFTRLVEYLASWRLLDLKIPAAEGESPALNISVVRGGKEKSIRIPDGTPSPAAASASWVVVTLVRAITAGTDWKNAAGHSINTGIDGSFVRETAGLTEDEAYAFETLAFSVRDATGKEVGTLQQTSPSAEFRLVLPPGTYRLVRPEPGAAGDASDPPGAKAYAWRAPATVKVEAGRYTTVTIRLEKLSGTP